LDASKKAEQSSQPQIGVLGLLGQQWIRDLQKVSEKGIVVGSLVMTSLGNGFFPQAFDSNGVGLSVPEREGRHNSWAVIEISVL